MTEADEFQECAGCICAGVRRAARTLSRHYERHMRGTGLRGAQFSTLVVLARGGPMPIGRLAKLLGVERTTLTRNLKPLENKHWVKFSGDADGRVRFVAITAKGRAVASAAVPSWRAAQASVGPKLKELRLAELLARAA
ncbi:MAG TPA: MarR family winged helix-turn-helix transcriptional regulator [Stellaceae bacterium]|jgi:DNA-binding MarR family transcriptional regulator|nr:MarR family winged helix-turn-helix transcriptional regulator [Stellaceae bacterium]